MANNINTVKDGPGLFAKGIAQTLKDNLVFCGQVDKADVSDFDGKNGFKSGDTIYTSIPPRYVPGEDNLDITSSIQDSVEEKKALVLNKTATIGMKLDSLELSTDVDVAQALKRFGMPAAESIAQNIESRVLGLAQDAVYNSVGTAGSNAFTVADILDARTKLNENLCPRANRKLLMTSAAGALAVVDRKGLFQSSDEIAKQYRDGMVGRSDGFDWYENELLNTHANGSDVTGIAVNDGSVAEGASTLTIDGASAAVEIGSVFTIAGVFAVHPITKVVTSNLQQFVATTSSTTSIGISPSIYAGSNGLQNVDALPADDAALTFVGAASTAFTQNLAFHPSAFKMVTAPLYAPAGVDLVATETVDGITVNIVRDFDVKTREVITRLDVLYGFDEVRPEWAVRITS
tara:strand:+ start:1838 stop:3049 length:1212 start_codon:yes stop_codon:yes gene_type:complete